MNASVDKLGTASQRGDQLRKSGDLEGAVKAYLSAAERSGIVPAKLCLSLARAYLLLDQVPEAIAWAVRVVDAGDDFSSWITAASLIEKACQWKTQEPRRRAKLAIAGSFTTTQLKVILPLAALRLGIELEVFEAHFGQYRQAILDPGSELYRFQPDFILLAVHERELKLPEMSENPELDIHNEIAHWTSLWNTAATHSAARVVQFNFPLPAEAPFGHLGVRIPGSRYAMTQAVNAGLGLAAASKVDILDCERLSALVGKERWIDPRYWHFSKQAVSLEALPLLTRHLAAVLAADLGLSRKCLVLDLDNTLWGGVIGEDGLGGIKLGGDQTGEAFVEFQEYILRLKDKGIILAVCSKNNEADAREPFEQHPEMKLKLEDVAAFVANWETKPDNLRQIAKILNIGLDSLVFVDDNPVECAAVRRELPQVDVIALPADPSGYTRRLAQYLLFETASFTGEDARRTAQYRARAAAANLEKSAGSIEELWQSLDMVAKVAPFDEINLARIVQLIGKTNQFNLTTRRHGLAQVEAFLHDPDCIHFYLRLRDRFADHGLVSLMIAFRRGRVIEIDTWLMSCRVIGRSVEQTMLHYLSRQAARYGAAKIRGLYIPSAKNELVADLYERMGFSQAEALAEGRAFEYELGASGLVTNPFIQIETVGE